METVQHYIDEQRKNIASMQAELSVLESAGLDLFVTKNEHGKREFESRDYSLADRVGIEQLGTYGVDFHLIQFMHDVETPKGNISVYCRHDGWHTDEKRYAQVSSEELPYNTSRHDIELLLDFYRQQGVNSRLLQMLRQQIEHLYQKPTPEELDLEALDEDEL
jgi:hypothetical protein